MPHPDIADRHDRLQAALDLTRHKLRVFPLHGVIAATHTDGYICLCGSFACSRKGKHPLARLAPHGCLDASSDEKRVRHWWECAPSANIGVACGHGLLVLDVDPRHGGDETLEKLEHENSPLPRTWRVRTGGGGEHFYFRTSVAAPNGVGKVGRGLDTRSTNGYVVGAGSQHESGRFYTWETDPDAVELADVPSWLAERARQGLPKKTALQPTAAWHALVCDGVSEGDRNNTIARLAGHLLRRLVNPHVVVELLRCWNAARCRPPLDDDELLKTIDSICSAELRRRRLQ